MRSGVSEAEYWAKLRALGLEIMCIGPDGKPQLVPDPAKLTPAGRFKAVSHLEWHLRRKSTEAAELARLKKLPGFMLG